MEYWIRQITEARQQQRLFSLCTLTRVEGSFGRSPGARMLVFEDGSPQGTIGGGPVEAEVIRVAKALLKEKKSEMLETHNPETGAKLWFFIESFLPEASLVIFGAGHVARSLIYFAKKLEFSITVVDEREKIFNDAVFEGIETKRLNYRVFLEDFDPTDRHFLVLCSHRHDYDFEILGQVLSKPWAYLGMIGNKQKIAEAKVFLQEKGLFDEAAFAKVDAPIGIPLPGKTPEIIGLSIASKLIMERKSV